MGRPRKYETAEELERACAAYFAQTQRPNLTGLCVYLDFSSRQTFLNYQTYGPDYLDVLKRAKLQCENYLEELLLDPKFSKTGAVAFILKAHYGWRDGNDAPVDDEPVDIGPPVINAPAEATE